MPFKFFKNIFPKHTLMGKLMGSDRAAGTGVQGAIGSLLKGKRKKIHADTDKEQAKQTLKEIINDPSSPSNTPLQAAAEATDPDDPMGMANAAAAADELENEGFGSGIWNTLKNTKVLGIPLLFVVAAIVIFKPFKRL